MIYGGRYSLNLMKPSCNDTKEKGWCRLEPGERIQSLKELKTGGFYLRKTPGHDGAVHYNVVEILDVPVDFDLVRENRVAYGRFVDPHDFTKPRVGTGDFFAIWWWELSDPQRDDAYYHLAS
jgi:hypothetical protein